MDVQATDRCSNCHCEFADHNYVKNSIDKYQCPHPIQEWGYGHYKGGDPRKFCPDYECCTPQEIERYKSDCDAWDKADLNGTPHPTEGRCGCCNGTYGIGGYVMEFESFFEKADVYESKFDLDDYIL